MNTPNIRFEGFTAAWEQRKLGDFFSERSERANGDEELLSVTIANGVIRQIDSDKRNTASEDKSNYKIVKKGDVPYNSMRMWQGAVGTSAYDGIVSPAYTVLTPKSNANGKFFMELFKKESTLEIFKRWSQGLTSDTWNLKFPALSTIVFAAPSLEEQAKIADYFTSIDNLIALHQRKCDDLQEVKKYMMQKLFPQNGAKIPEIRFAGFTGEWEQRKLGDWGDFYYGHSCPKWSVTEDATTPCIRYGELYTKFGAKIDQVFSYTNMPHEKLRFSKGTEVLIPRVGEDPMDYNHCTWLSLKDVAIGEMISVFNTEQNPLFSAIMFNATLQKEFAVRVEGGSVTNLYYEKLKNINVSYPSIPEQEKIADYFSTLDNLIALQQRKCDDLQEVKRYMLQNMFSQGK